MLDATSIVAPPTLHGGSTPAIESGDKPDRVATSRRPPYPPQVDSGSPWAFWIYLVPVTAMIFLTTYRLVVGLSNRFRRLRAMPGGAVSGGAVPGPGPGGPLDRPASGGFLRRPT